MFCQSDDKVVMHVSYLYMQYIKIPKPFLWKVQYSRTHKFRKEVNCSDYFELIHMLCCSLKISSWEGLSQTSCKFKLNFYNFKALLVTYWSFDRSKIGFFLYKTKTIVPFRNVSMVELITLMWFKHFYFVCTA